MKKLAVLLGLVGMLMLAVSMAQAQSQWAFYKENPVGFCDIFNNDGELEFTDYHYYDDSYKGPQFWLYESLPTEGVYLEDVDYFLDCCQCHGPDVKHGGPKLPASQCP